jgi:predicted acetylornithine/succinylornithine family transaminase
MTHDAIVKEADYVVNTYSRPPFVLVRGEGPYVWDTLGKRYLDFGSGIAVTALGHSHPALVSAIQEQAAQLSHVSNLYHTQPQADLAAKLCRGSFADKVYFCNSGAEASEAAIKFARKAAYIRGETDRTEAVVFSGAFHGRTAGALALTPREHYQKPFRPLMPGVHVAAFNDERAVAHITERTCAVFVEPIQGEGGVRPADDAFLHALRARCDEVGACLVFDEIQCGVGRSGTLWAHQAMSVTPDMMLSAKGLAGGLPIGAVLLTDAVAEAIEPGDHASTFAAGPVACTAALVTLAHIEELLPHINTISAYLFERLNALGAGSIVEVRGAGLMCGIELDRPAKPIMEAGYEAGVLVLTAGPNVVRLLPPYIIDESHVDAVVAFLAEVL